MTQSHEPTPDPKKLHLHEEPEIAQEEDVPLDGKDVEGERLMKEVRNPKLDVQPGEEEDSADPA